MQNMTADEDQAFRKALRPLLTEGFSVGVPKLAGSVGKGSLEGKLILEARKAPSATGSSRRPSCSAPAASCWRWPGA